MRRRRLPASAPAWRRWALRLARVAVAGLALGFAALEVAARWQPYDGAALARRPSQSQRVLDRDGVVLRERANADGVRAHWTPLGQISPWLVQAVVAVEDARFYNHDGVDWRGVGRAAAQSLAAGRPVSGASTLTMQLARLLRPHPKSLAGKIGEMVDARRLERTLSKEAILEQYLNRVPSAAGTVGVEAASLRLFGTRSRDLTVAQAALLAGLPAAPSRLDPVRNPRGARERQEHVLRRLLATGRIDLATWRAALAEPSRVARHRSPLRAAHFTEQVLRADLPRGDVTTTLSWPLQEELEAAVTSHVEAWGPRGVTQAAVVVLDNARCDVLALVGSRGWGEAGAAGAVNGALAKRQPGSTLKPFTYALAFEGGAGPGTVVPDVPTHYAGADGAVHSPRNYGRRYSGPVMMGDALARSLNVPAVRTLAQVGVANLLDRLRALGFDSLDRSADHYGLGLTLGNGEVTLLELAQGFAALARGGVSCRARLRPDQPVPLPGEVFVPEVADAITSILADEGLRARAFGADNALMLGEPMALKTGTSANWRDSWTVGYTAAHTVAVWSGDFEGRSMNQLTGAAGAGPLFRQVAERVFARYGAPRLPALRPGAPRMQRVSVCALSGQPAGPHCPHRRAVLSVAPAAAGGEEVCRWHREVLVDPHDGGLVAPECPSEHAERQAVEVLPSVYARWEAMVGRPGPPTRRSAHCSASGVAADSVAVTWPRAGEVYLLEPGYDQASQRLPLRASVDPPAPHATWTLDGVVLERVAWPYTLTWALASGRHELRVSAGGRTSAPVTFDVR